MTIERKVKEGEKRLKKDIEMGLDRIEKKIHRIRDLLNRKHYGFAYDQARNLTNDITLLRDNLCLLFSISFLSAGKNRKERCYLLK